MEQSLGPARPDILLRMGADKPAAAVEIVVAHEREAAAREFCASAGIPVVVYRLHSESDVDALRGHGTISVETTTCLRPKCRKCGYPIYERSVHVVTGQCYRCQQSMPIAFAAMGNEAFNPETFNSAEIQAARAAGCILRDSHSKTAESIYLANECPHCHAFTGNHFLAEFWHLAHSTNVVHRGPFCLECARGYEP